MGDDPLEQYLPRCDDAAAETPAASSTPPSAQAAPELDLAIKYRMPSYTRRGPTGGTG